jgi:ribosomal-protein-alanine N-acetyltransferase
MIKIIHAEEAHIPAVMKIEEACISPPWSEGALTNEIGRDDGLFALAICNGVDIENGRDADNGAAGREAAVLGFCIVRRMADEAELYQIAVRPDMRRHGIADRLMAAAESYCRAHHVRSIYLEVRRSNEPAIRLYKKHGFKNEGRRKNYYSSPVEDAVIMSRAGDGYKNNGFEESIC